MKVKSLSHVRLLVTPWTAAHQAPWSMGFSRQEYWSGVPLPSPVYASHRKLRKYRWEKKGPPARITEYSYMLPFPLVQLLNHVLLFCNPIDHSPPGSSVCGISQARILEWIAISFSSGSSWPQDQTCIYCIAGGFFTTKSPTHSSVLAWRIPGMAEPGGLPSMGLHRVGHDWSDLAASAPGLSTCTVSQFSESPSNGDLTAHLRGYHHTLFIILGTGCCLTNEWSSSRTSS